MKKIRTAVLMGGESAEREISILSGNQVLQSLDRSRHDPIGILIDSRGQWAIGPPGAASLDPATLQGFISPGRALDMMVMGKIDVVFIALHGPMGEDGTVQGMLELHHIPYTGSRVAASALAMDKPLSRTVLAAAGLQVPPGEVWTRRKFRETVGELNTTLSFPIFVKPACLGSSVGIARVANHDECIEAVKQAFVLDSRVLLEEEKVGVEITVPVLGNSEGDLEVLPPVEIVPQKDGFFTYEEKYEETGAREICPATSLSVGQMVGVKSIAEKAHRALGCDGMSRVDMIVGADQQVWILEINTIPGLTRRSLLPQSAAAQGLSFPALTDRLIDLARENFSSKAMGGG